MAAESSATTVWEGDLARGPESRRPRAAPKGNIEIGVDATLAG